MIRIVDIPNKFLPEMAVTYPSHQGNNPMIEKRAFNFFSSEKKLESDYIYLPIQWTSWHCQPGAYGENTQPLIDYCKELTTKHPNEKFFTIVQYDGGTLVPIDNCRIFASSGDFNSSLGNNSIYEPIPLLCDPHVGTPNEVRTNKVGFAGVETHPLRKKMYETLKDIDGYEFFVNYFHPDGPRKFKEILYNSVFALSPRGFGPASFRMYEAIQMQCIPIYISDVMWLPFTNYIEWDRMSLLIAPDEIESIPQKVDNLLESGEYQSMIDYGQEMYEKYLSWDGCLNTIAQLINSIQ